MSNLQRRRWHLRVAGTLVQLHRDERNPSSGAHYSQAGDGARPQYAQFSVRAGEWLCAHLAFARRAAFDRALGIFRSLPDSSPALVQRALEARSGLQKPLRSRRNDQSLSPLATMGQRRGDRNLLLTTYSRLTSMLALFGQQRESNELLQSW
ncbi:MAG: hypothetical protein U0175_37600 [Caldilineaceae bacterium]